MQSVIPTCSTKTVEIAGDSSSIVILHSPKQWLNQWSVGHLTCSGEPNMIC